MKLEQLPPGVLETSGRPESASKRIVLVVRAGPAAGLGVSISRTLREHNCSGEVVLLDEDQLSACRTRESLMPARWDVIRRAFADDRGVDVGFAPRQAPFKLATPRERTQADHERIAAAQQKRARKAARLRAVSRS